MVGLSLWGGARARREHLVNTVVCFFLGLFLLNTTDVIAQQNLFNIPSGDITPKKKFFYQHQLNFYGWDDLETKSHVVYGLGKGWDAGLNFVDLPLRLGTKPILSFNDDSNRKPLYPLLMATVQKGWQIQKTVSINVGTQIGPNLSSNFGNKKIEFNNYVLAKWKPNDKGYLVSGVYHANNVFVGGSSSQQIGFMTGYEYKLTQKLVLMGDFISGHHKKSQTVLGGGYTLGTRVQLFVGALLAFPNRKLNDGVVFELNWYGWDFMNSH